MEPISSAQYLCSEEGLTLLRETIDTVHAALRKINQLKNYVKQEMLQTSYCSEEQSNMTNVAIDYLNKSFDINSVNDCLNQFSESTLHNIKIERTDSSDYLYECGKDEPSGNSNTGANDCENFMEGGRPNVSSHIQLDNLFKDNIVRLPSQHEGVNLTSHNLNKHSAVSQEKTNFNFKVCPIEDDSVWLPPQNHGGNSKSQVFFTIVHHSLSEADLHEAFRKEGFKDFRVIVKNKELHSIGFIQFSNEDSAKRAIEMSLKIHVSGRPIKILPYRKKSEDNARNSSGLKSRSSINRGIAKEIDKNILINTSCGYQRNIVTDRLESFEARSFDVETNRQNTSQNKLIPFEPIPPPVDKTQANEAINTTSPLFRTGDSNFTHCYKSQNKDFLSCNEKDFAQNCIKDVNTVHNSSIKFLSENCSSVNGFHSKFKETPPLGNSLENSDKHKPTSCVKTSIKNQVLKMRDRHPFKYLNNEPNDNFLNSKEKSKSQREPNFNAKINRKKKYKSRRGPNSNNKKIKGQKNKNKFPQFQSKKRKEVKPKISKKVQKAFNS